MLRRPVHLLCGLAAVLAAAATPVAGASPAPRAALVHLACRSTLDPATRHVSVTAVMRPVAGTRSLAVRFTLLELAPTAAVAVPVSGAPGLGEWVTPAEATLGQRPGDVWQLAREVYDPPAPAAYRFRVEFRWTGAAGRVLATATRQTGTCGVRELRPDVLVRDVQVQPLPHRPTLERYVATIANRGATASGPFAVRFTPGAGATPVERRVGSLGPGAVARVDFLGPVCDVADPPVVLADPLGIVDDYDRADNELTVACPATAGS